MRILVIEDDIGTRTMIAAVLRREGFVVELSPNGRDGLEQAISWRPELVLTDIDMPELDGFGVLNGLRAHPQMADVPVIFLTVFEDRDVFRQSMKLGVDDFLNKPVKPQELIEAVATRLAKQRTAEITRQRRAETVSPEEADLASMYSRYLSGLSGARYNGVTTQQILAANQKTTTVTALLATVRNFPAFAQQLNENQSAALLSAWFSLTCPKIEQWGGTINAFLGEGLIALFGGTGLAPLTHTRYAMQAATAIVGGAGEFTRWCSTHFPGISLPPMTISVAVATGTVTFFEQTEGKLGVAVRGEAMALAAKLESRARELDWSIIANTATMAAAGLGLVTGARDVVRLLPEQTLLNVIEICSLPSEPPLHAIARLDQSLHTALIANSARAAPALKEAINAHRNRLKQHNANLPVFPGYRLMEKIGQGGMSEVWRAERVADGLVLVLKLIDIRADGDTLLLQRFLQEYKLVSALNHRNVVRIYGEGTADNHAFIAMEHFGAGDLTRKLANGVSVQEAVTLAGMTGEALMAIHAAGIVHRDVKPANLMLRDDGSLALCDFGIARELSAFPDLTKFGEMMGTPHYMSPEQIRGQLASVQSDLYSTGIVLFEMLAGQRPFAGATLDDLLVQHMVAAVPLLPPHAQAFQPVIERLLAKRPEDRFSNAREFIDALLTVEHRIG